MLNDCRTILTPPLESYSQAGLSMALGAFISGLLMAETEFALQVESDISPYKGLLLGLFFQTVSARALLTSRRFSFLYLAPRPLQNLRL